MSDSLSKQVGGDHYRKMVIQPIEFCQRNKLGAAESLAIKYICRHKDKNGRVDIEKAIHCLQLLLDIEYPVPEIGFDSKSKVAREVLKGWINSPRITPPIKPRY